MTICSAPFLLKISLTPPGNVYPRSQSLPFIEDCAITGGSNVKFYGSSSFLFGKEQYLNLENPDMSSVHCQNMSLVVHGFVCCSHFLNYVRRKIHFTLLSGFEAVVSNLRALLIRWQFGAVLILLCYTYVH